MSQFVLNLFDATHEQRITGVTSFIGEDASGCFGIQPNHARFMTTLVFGLARFRLGTEDWQYLALPGAVVYFNNNALTISTRQRQVLPFFCSQAKTRQAKNQGRHKPGVIGLYAKTTRGIFTYKRSDTRNPLFMSRIKQIQYELIH